MNRTDNSRSVPGPRPQRTSTTTPLGRTGWGGYGVAVMVAVIGALAAGLWAVSGYLDQVQRPEQFARAEVPGVASVPITQTGSHVIYVEGAGPATVAADDLTVTGPRSAPVQVRPYINDLRYDVPGASGQVGTAVAVFDADRTGTYRVSTDTAAPGGAVVVAVGDDLAPQVIRAVAIPSAIGILAVLAGLGLALGTWIHDQRRNDS